MPQIDIVQTPGQKLIQKAQNLGSVAKTFRGALAFLRSQTTPAIPGLAALGTATHPSNRLRRDRKIDFDLKLGCSHADRLARQAASLIPGLTATSPDALLEEGAAACTHMTGDLQLTMRRQLLRTIARRLERSLLNDWPYRASASTWAGGYHSVGVNIGDTPAASGGSARVWSANKKWSGTNSSARLTITERCVRTLGYSIIESGLIAVDAECVGNREYQVAWVEQARGFDLKLVSGWLIKGYHVTGGTLEDARRKVAKVRLQQAIERRVARLQGEVDSGRYDLSTVMVSRDDSIQAGNCAAGTNAFVKRFMAVIAGRKQIPADELLRLERSQHSLAAVTYALARNQHDAEIALDAASSQNHAAECPAIA
jgi:hypothetical protein